MPLLWARMLEVLVCDDRLENIWHAWPSPSEDAYWSGLPAALLAEIIHRESKVFPHYNVPGTHLSSSAGLLTWGNDAPEVLVALSQASVKIFELPERLKPLFQGSRSDLMELNPVTSRTVLLVCFSHCLPQCANNAPQNSSTLEQLAWESKMQIIDYLVVPGTVTPGGCLRYLHGLKIIPTVDSTFISLSQPGPPGASRFILATEPEATLFSAVDKSMIASWLLPSATLDLLQGPMASHELNVSWFRSSDLQDFLQKLLGHLSLEHDDVPLDQSRLSEVWFTTFWKWSAKQPILEDLLGRFHLVPTASGRLRLPGAGVLTRSIDHALKSCLELLGVSFASSTLKESWLIQSSTNIVRSLSDVRYVLDHVLGGQTSVMSAAQVTAIQQYFGKQASSPLRISPAQRQNFMQLPIFPVLDAFSSGNATTGRLSGSVIFVQEAVRSVPFVDGTTFMDVSPCQSARDLALLIESSAFGTAHSELSLLSKWVIPHLMSQPPQVLDVFIPRIILRANELVPSLRKFKTQAVIPTRTGSRRSLDDLIDPTRTSEIADLFRGEDDRFPSLSLTDHIISCMASNGLLQSHLTPSIVDERITYFSGSHYAESVRASSPQSFAGPTRMIRLMDLTWDPSYSNFLQRQVAWIPIQSTRTFFHKSATCRPQGVDDHLFDLVLPRVPVEVKNQQLLESLRWHETPTLDVLVEQLGKAVMKLRSRTPKNARRIVLVLRALSHHHSESPLPVKVLTHICTITRDKEWIPLESKHFVSNCHALLSQHHPLHGVGDFRHLPCSFTDDKDIIAFLLELGCSFSCVSFDLSYFV